MGSFVRGRDRIWIGLVGLGVLAFAFAGIVSWKAPKLVEIFLTANILGGNFATGVEHELAYQIIGHASLLALGVGFWTIGSALLRVLRDRPGARTRMLVRALLSQPWLTAAMLVALVFAAMLGSRFASSEDGYFVGLDDDAMISLRYSWNFAHGRGLIYNVGERVEGYTNFLWTFIGSLPFLFGASKNLVGLLVLTANFVLVALTAYTMNGALRAMRVPRWAILAALIAFVFDCNTIYFAGSGLETALLACLVSAGAFFVLRGSPTAAFVALGAIPLTRSDGAILALLLGSVAAIEFRRAGKSLRALPAVFLPAVCHVATRKLYYGEWYPNTYFLKMLDVHDRLPMGLGSYGFRVSWLYGPLIALAVASIALRRHRLLACGFALPVLVLAVYGVYVGGDAFWFVRFLAPTLPLLYIGAARTLGAAVPDARRAPAAMLSFGAVVLALAPVQTEFGRLGQQISMTSWVLSIGSTAAWMRANLPPGALSTVYPAGGIPYFAPDTRFIDVLGKNDHHIGHLRHYESVMIGHNRFDFDYVYGERKPDIAFVDRACAHYEAPRYMSETERVALRQHDIIQSPAWDYDRTNPHFIESYSLNAVHYVGGAPRIFGCIFVREGANVAQFWSRQGAPPRASRLQYVFGAENADGRIALGGRWKVQPPSEGKLGFGTSQGTTDGQGHLDAWLDAARPVRIETCYRPVPSREDRLEDATDEPLVVNGAPTLPVASTSPDGCSGERRSYVIEKAVLERRPQGTRIVFPASLDVHWVKLEARP